jgi:hypothetical protein
VVFAVVLAASCGSDGDGEEISDDSAPAADTGSESTEGAADSGEGGEPEVSDEAGAWAEDVCGSLETWAEDLATVADDLEAETDAGDLSGLRETVGEAIDATQGLLDDLDAISPPETEQGEATQAQLQELGEQARAGLEEIEQGLDALDEADSAEDGLQALIDVAEGVGEQLGPVGDTLDELEQQDPDSELLAALRADPACQSLEG